MGWNYYWRDWDRHRGWGWNGCGGWGCDEHWGRRKGWWFKRHRVHRWWDD